MKKARSKYLLEFVTELDPYLKVEGFRRKNLTYGKKTENYWLLIHWQISTDDIQGCLKFTINVGVHDLKLAARLEEDVSQCPDIWGCHLRQRIGFLLPEHHDKWWVVDLSLSVSSKLVDEFKALLKNCILPFLSQFSAKDDLLNLWKTGVAPGQTDRQRQSFIGFLDQER